MKSEIKLRDVLVILTTTDVLISSNTTNIRLLQRDQKSLDDTYDKGPYRLKSTTSLILFEICEVYRISTQNGDLMERKSH